MGTRWNHLTEAVLTCTHDLCFEQKLQKYYIFSSENYRFYSREILQYIARTCLRNVSLAGFTYGVYQYSGLSLDQLLTTKERMCQTLELNLKTQILD